MHKCNRRRDARVQGRKVKEECREARIKGCKSVGMQQCRKARVQECKSAGKQDRRNARVQGSCVKELRSAERQEQK
jgi:hypothetical protein